MVSVATRPEQHANAHADTATRLWALLTDVPDPEIPVLSVVDLGIVRDVVWDDASGAATIVITPTYSGCPATEVIAEQIRTHLAAHGFEDVTLRTQLSPAWTTDWLTPEGAQKLKDYGIAPPTERAASSALVSIGVHIAPLTSCPLCGSARTETVSQFGSTPCKSLHRCLDCLEPFDHFKCH